MPSNSLPSKAFTALRRSTRPTGLSKMPTGLSKASRILSDTWKMKTKTEVPGCALTHSARPNCSALRGRALFKEENDDDRDSRQRLRYPHSQQHYAPRLPR